MKSFLQYTIEAWYNEIPKEGSREKTVTGKTKYDPKTDFKNATKVGEVNGLHIYSSSNGQGGLKHFTWSPSDRMIHHVIHAVEATDTDDGKTQLKYLSAHGRKTSPVRMGKVYSHLVKNNNIEFVGTGHSEGAQKMWSHFHDDPQLEIVGKHPDGTEVPLNKNSQMYANKKTKDQNERKIGRMSLVLRKKQTSGN
jgi:hypothetical protein